MKTAAAGACGGIGAFAGRRTARHLGWDRRLRLTVSLRIRLRLVSSPTERRTALGPRRPHRCHLDVPSKVGVTGFATPATPESKTAHAEHRDAGARTSPEGARDRGVKDASTRLQRGTRTRPRDAVENRCGGRLRWHRRVRRASYCAASRLGSSTSAHRIAADTASPRLLPHRAPHSTWASTTAPLPP